MKKQAKRYCPKIAMTFTANDITILCTHAPNNIRREEILLFYNRINTFLINYQKERCSDQVIGINEISNKSQKIALFFGERNPESYSSHLFRRISATLLDDASTDIIELKCNSGWEFTAVAKGYLGYFVDNNKITFAIISNSTGMERSPELP